MFRCCPVQVFRSPFSKYTNDTPYLIMESLENSRSNDFLPFAALDPVRSGLDVLRSFAMIPTIHGVQKPFEGAHVSLVQLVDDFDG